MFLDNDYPNSFIDKNILYYLVFFLNSIKPDEVGKPIVNETSLQFWHNEEFSSLYFTLIDRKPTSFMIFTMEGDTTSSSTKSKKCT